MKKNLLDVMAAEGAPTRALVSKLWRRYALRGIGANDNHTGLDRLYALPDPWGMTTEREQSRFTQTNDVIRAQTGHVDTLLEIGSGEGHQSEHLAHLCSRLYGVDVSERAVERARARLPQAQFGVGEVTALPWAMPETGKFDLVVACEVLYYLSDIGQAVECMSRLGRSCLVTFFCPSARRVAEHLLDLPGLQRGWIYHDPYAWLWAFWRPSDSATGQSNPNQARS